MLVLLERITSVKTTHHVALRLCLLLPVLMSTNNDNTVVIFGWPLNPNDLSRDEYWKRYQDCSYNWILTPRMRELSGSNLLPKRLWRIFRSNLRWVNQWFFKRMGFGGKPRWSVKIAIVDSVSQSNAFISRYLVDNHVLLHLAAIDCCSICERVRSKEINTDTWFGSCWTSRGSPSVLWQTKSSGLVGWSQLHLV